MADTEVHTTDAGVEFVRTPEERFAQVDFPYTPSYVDVDGLRMAYYDEGPAEAEAILLLHGEPTWSYLYRRMIPPLLDAGYRIVAPDLIGFGRSDKPTKRSTYTYENYVRWMSTFLDAVPNAPRAVFCQDWGGLIALRLAGEQPDRFGPMIAGNTGLPVGESLGDGFLMWRTMSQDMEFMDCGDLLAMTMGSRELTDAEKDGYRAPFPDEQHMAGARQFPLLVPVEPDNPAVPANQAAWAALGERTDPFLTLWCPGDIVLGGLQHVLVDHIPGAAGQPHQQFEPGGHFIQDDRGEDIAAATIEWLSSLD